MHIALAFLTFAFFITVDYVLTRRREGREAPEGLPVPVLKTPVPATAPALEPAWASSPAPEPVWVAGYQLPAKLHYHSGHTWAWAQDAETVVVGIDDFSRRLIGKADGVKLPSVGDWVRQGEPGLTVSTNGRSVALIAPIEGEVVALNKDVKADPSVLTNDPYGHGWAYKIRPSNLRANMNNLLSGSLAKRWTEDASDQLELRLMALSGSVLQDGGEPSPDFAEHLENDDWVELAGHFLMAPARSA